MSVRFKKYKIREENLSKIDYFLSIEKLVSLKSKCLLFIWWNVLKREKKSLKSRV